VIIQDSTTPQVCCYTTVSVYSQSPRLYIAVAVMINTAAHGLSLQ